MAISFLNTFIPLHKELYFKLLEVIWPASMQLTSMLITLLKFCEIIILSEVQGKVKNIIGQKF